jgi:colicin import membrane protein
MVDEYVAKIQARVKARIIRTGCLPLTNPEIHLKVILLPDGNVLGDPEVRKSSGAAACDNAVARAVLSAQPLPVPSDPALFQKLFRDLNLTLRPNE